MPMSIPDTPDVVTPVSPPPTEVAALVASSEEGIHGEPVVPFSDGSPVASPTGEENESFKQLLRDFVLGNNQNPDDMPGLRFYIVFAGMLVLALVGVALVATLIGFVRWLSLFFR